MRSLTALGTVLLLATAGIAHAQSTGNPPASTKSGAETNRTDTYNQKSTGGTQGTTGNAAAGAVKNPPGAESTTGAVTGGAAFDRSVVGQSVFNRNGEAIGQVKSVQGDRIVVSVGSYLGVGTRDISLNRSQLDTKTTTQNRLTTTLSKDELAAQPEVSMNTGTSGSTRSSTPAAKPAQPMQRDGTSGTVPAPK